MDFADDNINECLARKNIEKICCPVCKEPMLPRIRKYLSKQNSDNEVLTAINQIIFKGITEVLGNYLFI